MVNFIAIQNNNGISYSALQLLDLFSYLHLVILFD